jgi:Domain of Unknown Function (DUF1080)
MKGTCLLVLTMAPIALCASRIASAADATPPPGFVALFDGKDLSGWKIPEGDNGHWKVVDGVIDYDARSEAKGEKSLWSEKSFGDFILRIDWRMKTDEPGYLWTVPVLGADGNPKKDADGKEIKQQIEDVDSGIYLRGSDKAQVNIWRWPVGSGEVWGYRTDRQMSPEVRAAVTPKKNADRPRGEWNTFEITMKGDRLWVKLNGEEVISDAQLPGVPREGPIALQHHGQWNAKRGKWTGPPALVQFRNIFIKELK